MWYVTIQVDEYGIYEEYNYVDRSGWSGLRSGRIIYRSTKGFVDMAEAASWRRNLSDKLRLLGETYFPKDDTLHWTRDNPW